MKNKDKVFLELFHRDEHSLGAANRQKHGEALYHWAVLVTPAQMSPEAKCTSFDATDGVRDRDGRNQNQAGAWWFRRRSNVNPLNTGHFLGAVMIGKVPEGTTMQQIEAILERVNLPKRGQKPEQNCVTWTRQAIEALQRAGLAEKDESPGAFMHTAFGFADKIMDGKVNPRDWKKRFINGTGRRFSV